MMQLDKVFEKVRDLYMGYNLSENIWYQVDQFLLICPGGPLIRGTNFV